jgi:hypothetical protein
MGGGGVCRGVNRGEGRLGCKVNRRKVGQSQCWLYTKERIKRCLRLKKRPVLKEELERGVDAGVSTEREGDHSQDSSERSRGVNREGERSVIKGGTRERGGCRAGRRPVLREVKYRWENQAGVLNSEEVRKGGHGLKRCAIHGEGMQGGVKGLVSREAKGQEGGTGMRPVLKMTDLGKVWVLTGEREGSLTRRMQGGCSNVLALILMRY